MRGMKYRSDIDGLRAVAILPVVAYHAGLALVPGGFVGVDVFFVISGYLICRLINDEIKDGSFTVAAFYKRRVMRLFPALFAMLLATSVLAYLYLLPIELKEFSDSMIAAVTYVSNIFFALTTGYFDAPAETKPLLHTWSLSVEEQFYIVCPLFMLACYRFCPRRLNALVAIGALLSFAAAVLAYTRNPTFAFFLTPFRAWELLLGALLGIRFFPVATSSDLKSVIGGAGLALVLFAVFGFSRDTPLPLATATACIGTALIIHSSENGISVVGRLLSWRPAVFIGLISYSLYLWHWPIMVFQRSDGFLFAQTSVASKLGLIAVSIGVAYLSWKFVELPFRIRTKTISVRLALGGALASMAVVGALGAAALALGGAPYRFPAVGRHHRLVSRLRSGGGIPRRPVLSGRQPANLRCQDLPDQGCDAAELPADRRQPRRAIVAWAVVGAVFGQSDAGDGDDVPPRPHGRRSPRLAQVPAADAFHF